MRKGFVAALWLAGISSATLSYANYSGVDAFEQYGDRVHAAQQVTPLGDNIFGDQVSLYNGSTTFGATDVSVPGNDTLPVALSRVLSIQDHRVTAGGTLHGFGDWDLDVPYIDGTFTQNDGWTLYPNGATNRCSDNTDWPYTLQSTPYGWAPYESIWDGNHLHIPGAGDQELLANSQSKSPAHASASTYKWVTSGNWKLSCISTVSNLSGEGFVAVSPSGVSYTFNWAVTRQGSNFAWQYKVGLQPAQVPRVHIYLLATHVQDRFGNWVNYSYGGPNGDELTSITSKDGRKITLIWDTTSGTITSATSEPGTPSAQTWNYSYVTNASGAPILSAVTRPDGSNWTYAIVSGSLLTTKHSWPAGDVPPSGVRVCQGLPDPNTGSYIYQIGTPSGASATFTFEYDRHYRDMVPFGCTQDAGPTENYSPQATDFFDNFTLLEKQVSGPGLAAQTWTYNYGRTTGSYFTASAAYGSSTVEPFIPPGSCSTCNATNTVTVTGPTSITKYTFGTQYARNEAQLLDTEVDDLSGNLLKATTSALVSDDDAPNEPFPNVAGYDLLPNFQNPMGNRIRPVVSTQIAQDSATFTTDVNSFDAFARTTNETASSTLGCSKTIATSYYDDMTHWVLGQVLSTAINGTAGPCTAGGTTLTTNTTYDSTTALPISSYAFGKLVSTKAWHVADGTAQSGTLASVTDGNGNTTTLSNWYRGIPQTVQFADNTHQTATVDDAGRITSVTDENNSTTGYQYDLMGRLKEIDYPSGPSDNWNPTTLSFASVNGVEYDIPAGHWKQTVQTGTLADGYATTVTYFDALWRPLVTESYDSANPSGTRTVSVKRYDAGGRVVYASYPLSSLGSYTDAHPGTYTSYDGLDRVTEVDADWELESSAGLLQSKIAYLSGFKTKTTDPNGDVTTTSYQAFGAPDTSHPLSIALPEDVTTTISRDVLGKPLSITRSGPYNGSTLSATRSYVYDANQQLCKRIDPESGARVMAYDSAGNLQWSAAGLNLPSTTSCDTSTAYSSGRRVDRAYDARNRVTSVTYPDGFSNTSMTYAPDGALLTERVDNAGQPVTTTYAYDKRRLLTSESLSIPNTSPLGIEYSYDANGHLASNTYPDGRNIAYSPNALGQPTQAGAYASGVSYYPNGAIKQFTYGDGTLHTLTQNTRQLPDESKDSYAGAAVLDDGRDYDPNGNVAGITDYLGNVTSRTMSYDGLNRLIETDASIFGGDNKAVYGYDSLDNLRSGRIGNYINANYQYDATNRLTGLTDPVSGSSMVSYGYDVQGNITARNNQTYQFDEANRLRGVPGVETYLYDAGGRRVQKTQSMGGAVIDADYSKAGQLMYRGDAAATTGTDYIYLDGSMVAAVTNNATQVLGTIDGAPTTDNPTIGGWACSSGMDQSINVELYVGGTPSNGGTHLGTYAANVASEPAVASSCQASGSNYRFSIALDSATRAQYAGQLIYMYGDSPVGNNNNELTNSGQYAVPANPTPPAAPGSINVPSSSNASSVTISWTASSNASSYTLQQSFNGGAWTQIYSGAATSNIAAVNNGSYQFRVEACNAAGCSAFATSTTLSVAIIPAAPASINAPATSYAASFTVSWSASSYTSSYVLQQSANGGAWTQIYSGGATSATATVSASGNYQYRVQACGAGGCSGYRTSGTVAVTLKPSSAPSLSGPSSSTSGTYTLSWTAISGATRYQLNQKINSGSWSAVYNSSGRSWSSSGVSSGTYAYVVYACNVAGCSAASNQVTVTVARVPDAPASMTAPTIVQANTAFSVSWSASSGATSYNVQRTNLSAGGSAIVYTGSLTGTSTMPGPADDNYQYAVDACNANGCSGWTNAGNHTYVQPRNGGMSEPASGSTQ